MRNTNLILNMLDNKDLVNDESTEQSTEVTQSTPEVQEVSVEAVEEVITKREKPEDSWGAHDDFDWDADGRNIASYSDADVAKYSQDYEASLSSVAENSVVSGIVTAMHSGDVHQI